MKKLVLLIAVMSLNSLAYSQEKKDEKEGIEVPGIVEKAFHTAYPNATAEWEDENGKYEGSFKHNGQEMSVVYNAQGILEEKETEIKVAELPLKIPMYVTKNKLGKIKEAAKIVKADGTVMYEAELKSGDALFDAKGNFIKINKD